MTTAFVLRLDPTRGTERMTPEQLRARLDQGRAAKTQLRGVRRARTRRDAKSRAIRDAS